MADKASPDLWRARAETAYLHAQWLRLVAACNGDSAHAYRVWRAVWRRQAATR